MSTGAEQLAAQRAINEAYHNSLPDVFAMPSRLDPSGLVPYACGHGIATKPKGYPTTKFNPHFDAEGGELPPYGGRTWGRSKYLMGMERVMVGDKHIQYRPKCIVCEGLPPPADFTTPREKP